LSNISHHLINVKVPERSTCVTSSASNWKSDWRMVLQHKLNVLVDVY